MTFCEMTKYLLRNDFITRRSWTTLVNLHMVPNSTNYRLEISTPGPCSTRTPYALTDDDLKATDWVVSFTNNKYPPEDEPERSM